MKGSKEVFLEIKHSIESIYGAQESESIAYRMLDLVFGVGKLDFLLNKELELPASWDRWLKEMVQGKPFQYVVGKEFFRDLVIELNDSTLIPRPETEELVQYMLQVVQKIPTPIRVLDIGTGSGCIPLALKNEYPAAQVFGWDIAENAINQAKLNAQRLNLEVKFQLQNIFEWENREEKWDVIVSNPPYVLDHEKSDMLSHVLEYEPALALFVPDEQPLLFYECIAEMGKNRLNGGGYLFFEINQAFGKEIQEMLIFKGFKEVEVIKDFRGKERFVRSKK